MGNMSTPTRILPNEGATGGPKWGSNDDGYYRVAY